MKKSYRPFKTIEEFLNHMNLDQFSDKIQFIEFRIKSGSMRYYLAYNGYDVSKHGTVTIHVGSHIFTLQELFEYYEYTLNGLGEWLPFGIECEEEHKE